MPGKYIIYLFTLAYPELFAGREFQVEINIIPSHLSHIVSTLTENKHAVHFHSIALISGISNIYITDSYKSVPWFFEFMLRLSDKPVDRDMYERHGKHIFKRENPSEGKKVILY